MVYCIKCGKELPDDAYFCSACGQRTSRAEEEGVPARQDLSTLEGSIETMVSQAVRTIEETVRSATEEARTGSWDTNRYQVEEERTLTGSVETDKLLLEVESRNGKINVGTWDKPEYKIDLLIKAWGYTEEEADENLKALIVDFSETEVEGLKKISLGFDHPAHRVSYSVRVDATLPKGVETDLNLKTSNGSINLAELDGSKLDLHTSNGKILMENITAERLDGKTSNGAVVLDGVDAQILNIRTSNGKIKGELKSRDAYLKTSNGKIQLSLPCNEGGNFELRTSHGTIDLGVSDNPDNGYDLDLTTSMGRISVDLPELEYLRSRKHHVAVKSRGFEEKGRKIGVVAKTSMGRISVHA
ncbi:DUF4097 family beta strand repeat protein [Candidatus Bathyarchaeota archaeon]|nr:DUF4097 family beta strand repeat protein [Candidatus Bathyarchaeota archaeon]